jgi:hypothetical protein
VATNNRPYIEMYTKDLIQLVDKIKEDKNALVALKYEISFRNKADKKLASTVAKADRYIELFEHRTSSLKDSKVEPTSNALMLRAKAREEAREAGKQKYGLIMGVTRDCISPLECLLMVNSLLIK